MSYIGGLTKTELAGFLATEMKPLIEELKELKSEVAELRQQLHHKHKELYTIDDLVELFNVTRATIHNWINDGKLVRYKIGGRTEFKRGDVEKLINYSKK